VVGVDVPAHDGVGVLLSDLAGHSGVEVDEPRGERDLIVGGEQRWDVQRAALVALAPAGAVIGLDAQHAELRIALVGVQYVLCHAVHESVGGGAELPGGDALAVDEGEPLRVLCEEPVGGHCVLVHVGEPLIPDASALRFAPCIAAEAIAHGPRAGEAGAEGEGRLVAVVEVLDQDGPALRDHLAQRAGVIPADAELVEQLVDAVECATVPHPVFAAGVPDGGLAAADHHQVIRGHRLDDALLHIQGCQQVCGHVSCGADGDDGAFGALGIGNDLQSGATHLLHVGLQLAGGEGLAGERAVGGDNAGGRRAIAHKGHLLRGRDGCSEEDEQEGGAGHGGHPVE